MARDARASALSVAQKQRGPRPAPACARLLTSGPRKSERQTEEAASTALNMAKLADDDSSGEMEDTYVIYVTRHIDQCYYCDLGLTEGSSLLGMAARQSSGVSCRRRQAMAGLTEHGMSYRRSPRCYPSKEKRREGS